MESERLTLPEIAILLGIAIFFLALGGVFLLLQAAKEYPGGGSDAFLIMGGLFISYIIPLLMILPASFCLLVRRIKGRAVNFRMKFLLGLSVVFLILPVLFLSVPAQVLGPLLRN